MNNPLVSLIVLNWNGEAIIRECIDSLKNLNYKNIEIIVVDNASTDASLELLASIQNIIVIKNATNAGYAGGNNRGFTVANGDFVATINNDIIVEPSWLDTIVPLLKKDPTIGIVGGRQMNYFDRTKIDALYSFLHHSMIFFQEAFRETYNPDRFGEKPLRVLSVSGAATVYRKTLLDEMKGFDESLYAYHEESDLCMRAFLKGWKCIFVPTAVAYHRRSVSFNRIKPTMIYYQTRNRIWFIYKYSSAGSIIRNWFWLIVTELRILRVFTFRDRAFFPYVKGLTDGFSALGRFKGVRKENMENLLRKKAEYDVLVQRRFLPFQ